MVIKVYNVMLTALVRREFMDRDVSQKPDGAKGLCKPIFGYYR